MEKEHAPSYNPRYVVLNLGGQEVTNPTLLEQHPPSSSRFYCYLLRIHNHNSYSYILLAVTPLLPTSSSSSYNLQNSLAVETRREEDGGSWSTPFHSFKRQ